MSKSSSGRYGHRHEILHNKQGSPFNVDTPLAAEDFLDPRPGDVFYHGARHDLLVTHFYAVLRRLFRSIPTISVLRNIKLILPPPAAHHPIPDLVIIENLPAPSRPRTMLDLHRDGVIPACIIEITSPLFRHYDIETKPQLYAAAGITEYIVLDLGPGTDPENTGPASDLAVMLFRLPSHHTPAEGYTHVSPTTSDRIFSQVLNTEIMIAESTFQLIDPATGQPILPAGDDEESLSAAQAEGRFRAQSIASQLKL